MKSVSLTQNKHNMHATDERGELLDEFSVRKAG